MYQKCVCFIFLVILAVLSCSGFRIDSIAMTDLTKKNFHTSPDKHDTPHRIRHHRLWRTQAQNRYPKPPYIDVIVYPPPPPPSSKSITSQDFSSSTSFWPYRSSEFKSTSSEAISEFKSTSSEVTSEFKSTSREVTSEFKSTSSQVNREFKSTSSEVNREFKSTSSEVASNFESTSDEVMPTKFPNENLAQIPPTDFVPVNFVVSRLQRSPNHRRRVRWTAHQNEDFFSKAYKAKYVVIAEVESKPRYINDSNGSCQCYVKVIRDFKGNAGNSFGLVHKFLRHMLTARCDLVKEMKNSKKYMLLLDENLQLLDTPKPKEKVRKGMTKRLKRLCKSGFVPTRPHVIELKEVAPKSPRKIEKRNRILICSVRGFPPPKITWRRRNEALHQSRSFNILYKRKQSKLVIKKPDVEYLGQYECVAESSNGHTATKNFTLLPPQPSESISSDKECSTNFKEAFCQNGGTCFYERTINFYGCICPENYSGEKCEVKNPGNTSMYPQPDLYACNLGLSTKYNC